jgi:alkanesulfonate monooxygenase SsuD/methylene tetrahydromethanopterin reductase-like flavin-dependent oxidoreductase (luciferase family)
MRIGAIVPQGWVGDYDGWQPLDAWRRTTEVARQADRLGFESIWLFDHFHTVPRPTDEITFESFTSLSALAALTSRVRLGHIVICTAFRNPALTAKMISTMDSISAGRVDLGIGAGWKEDEWLAYVPIMVGGNGPNVTWRLAARHADELNVDGMSPADVKQALPVIRSRCEEIGRDPATLAISVHIWQQAFRVSGPARVDLLGEYRELGVDRVMGLDINSALGDEAMEAVAADARAAGVEMAPEA